jgi:hypothetical protein
LRQPVFFDDRAFAAPLRFFAAAGLVAEALPLRTALTALPVRARFFSAERCAAASAALAHWVNSSGSSNSRAGNCQ